MKKILSVVAVALLVSVVAMAGAAMAATVTSAISVSATVQASCAITTPATALAFGPYDPLSPTPTDTAGQVDFRCTRNTLYWTYIAGSRTMTDGTDTLNFEVYSDAGRSTVYPSTKAGAGAGTTSASNNPQTVPYYGRIPVNQYVGANVYNGSVDLTVEW